MVAGIPTHNIWEIDVYTARHLPMAQGKTWTKYWICDGISDGKAKKWHKKPYIKGLRKTDKYLPDECPASPPHRGARVRG